jgi:damage-control phosphatase, subfamily I
MKVNLDCFPCFVRQALEAARMASDDEHQHRALLDHVMRQLTRLPLEVTPPQVGQLIHRLIRQHINSDDPYRQLKDRDNKVALEMLPELRERVLRESDPLRAACQLAIAGNAIDCGASSGGFDLVAIADEALGHGFAVDDYVRFRAALDRAERVLYLGDNCGEIVFDRLLVESIYRRTDAHIDFAVRGRPVLNDANMEDAMRAGMDLYAEIISNGSDAPATVLSECSRPLQDTYREADVIVAKGQGNYESLSQESGPLFYLLKAKCAVVARDIDVPVDAYVLKAAAGAAAA